MQNYICPLLVLLLLSVRLEGQTHSRETVVLETPHGTIKLKLFEETPLHKANFLKLVSQNYFDSLLFHRVINEFMIQGGDPLSRQARKGDSLGHGDAGYLVPAEFNRQIIHRKGRLCAARDNDDINPSQASSASQFYIVMGKVRTREELGAIEDKMNKRRYKSFSASYAKTDRARKHEQTLMRYQRENKADSAALKKTEMEEEVKAAFAGSMAYRFTEKDTEVYTTAGGTPHLDGSYTVFGEVIEGIEVVDRIAAVKTDGRDRPLEDIRMKIKIINQ